MYHVGLNWMEKITRCTNQLNVKEVTCESSNESSSKLRKNDELKVQVSLKLKYVYAYRC